MISPSVGSSLHQGPQARPPAHSSVLRQDLVRALPYERHDWTAFWLGFRLLLATMHRWEGSKDSISTWIWLTRSDDCFVLH